MPSADCPEWEYDRHPRRLELQGRIQTVVRELGARRPTAALLTDTRPVHARLFDGLTPTGFEYYAGHYRGEDFPCLRSYYVEVGGDPALAAAPALVQNYMSQLAIRLVQGIAALDYATQERISASARVLTVVQFACRVFELFLRIHPYANGNGHVARFVVWGVLGRYGYLPKGWPIDPRPSDPPYTQLIAAYRAGDVAGLESFIPNCLI